MEPTIEFIQIISKQKNNTKIFYINGTHFNNTDSSWMNNQPRLLTILNYSIQNNIDMKARIEQSSHAYQAMMATQRHLEEQKTTSFDTYKKIIVNMCDT